MYLGGVFSFTIQGFTSSWTPDWPQESHWNLASNKQQATTLLNRNIGYIKLNSRYVYRVTAVHIRKF